MQPLKYYPQPERPSDPTPLEMAIYNYELKAKAFYDKKAQLGDAKESDITERLNQDYKHLEQDYKHLEQERNRLAYIITAQASLKKYREHNASKSSSVSSMMKESYHPASGKKGKLGKYLAASGEPRPTLNHEAHHIIPGLGSEAMQDALRIARMNLHLHGIGINDPMNGIWLYGVENGKEFDWATPNASSHRRIHRYNYDVWIATTFRLPSDKLRFVNLLNEVKGRIKNGIMPPQVMLPKDENWSGKS